LYCKGVEKRVSTLVVALIAIAVVLAALPAAAQRGVEAQARSLDKKAMEDDYLATEFEKAADKVNKAIGLCGDGKCGPAFRAQLRRDLGVILLGSGGDKERAIQSFVDALKIDPNVTLDPDVKTKELDAAFEQARRRAGLVAAGSGGASSSGALPTGDFIHTPANEQRVRTPVPVYVEYAGVEALVKVMIRYKAVGMTDFKALELRKLGKGWGGEIPCADVLEGQVVYYLQGFNDKSEPVATSGDRNNTYRVPIKQKLDGEPPHNPDQPPPSQCGDSSDCPPGFPCETKGAGGEAPSTGTKLEGESCDIGSECKSGDCKEGKCTAPDAALNQPKLFLGLGVSLDLTFLSSGQDVCLLNNKTALPVNDAGYYCTNPSGTDYPRRDKNLENGLLTPGKAGSVNGGVAPGNVRLSLSLDYAVFPNLLLGVRLGLVLRNTYPGQAAQQDGKAILPFHAEARATYLIGRDPLVKAFAPYIVVGAGASQFTASVDVPVSETGANPPTKTVQAWMIGGPGFATLGAGMRFGMGKAKRVALMFSPLKGNVAFGSGALVLSLQPELGIQFGF